MFFHQLLILVIGMFTYWKLLYCVSVPPPDTVPSYPGMLSNILAGGALGPSGSAAGGANIASTKPEEPVQSLSLSLYL